MAESSNGMPTNTSHKQDWENLAATDPLWAICSDPDKRQGRWDLDEFMSTGTAEAALVMERARSLGLPQRREFCLDFGCGVGRVTRALSLHFKNSVGVDISEMMTEKAAKLSPQCTFYDLATFDFPESRFDLIYCNIVLQHQPSKAMALDYVGKFFKMVAPGGLIVFQLPTHIPLKNRLQPRRRLYHLLRSIGVPYRHLMSVGLQPISMLAIPEQNVRDFIERRARLLGVFACRTVNGITANEYYCSTSS